MATVSSNNNNANASFELRNATLTLVALVLKTTDLDELSQALEARFGPTPALFDHDPVVIDLSSVEGADQRIDFAALSALLQARKMLPVGVERGSPQQMAAALAAGLGEALTFGTLHRAEAAGEHLHPQQRQPHVQAQAQAQPGSAAAASARSAGQAAPAAQGAQAVQVTATSSAQSVQGATAPAAAAPTPAAPTLVIDRPLRSGQQVYARGGDLVVMAAVNFGAEVIADGHIHVYAPLRGRAIAGARGNAAARIISTCMQPQLVSIAGTYRTLEAALPADVLGKPAQVRLDGDTLVVEALAA